MGEIISDISDLAIVISAEEVLSWTDEAMEILKEKIPRVADESELTHIDYGEIINAMNDYREFNIDDFIQSASQPCPSRLKGMSPEELRQFNRFIISWATIIHEGELCS